MDYEYGSCDLNYAPFGLSSVGSGSIEPICLENLIT